MVLKKSFLVNRLASEAYNNNITSVTTLLVQNVILHRCIDVLCQLGVLPYLLPTRDRWL